MASSLDALYKRYVKSETWRCPAGGAHEWVQISGMTWRCRKCGQEKVIETLEYSWNTQLEMRYLAPLREFDL
jgi:ribosomal protein L37AE/L43A